jgi:hypothetical protein
MTIESLKKEAKIGELPEEVLDPTKENKPKKKKEE